jgi:hypothetical protein
MKTSRNLIMSIHDLQAEIQQMPDSWAFVPVVGNLSAELSARRLLPAIRATRAWVSIAARAVGEFCSSMSMALALKTYSRPGLAGRRSL